MIERILAEFENPEFWVAVAFFLAVIPLIRPAFKGVKEWSKGQASAVQKELDEAANLRKEAEDLYAEYEQRTKNIEKERTEILRSAEREVITIQQDADEKLTQKLASKKKEVQDRIQSIETNARNEFAQEVMTNVMAKTKDMISTQAIRQSEADMDKAMEQIFAVLEKKSA